MDGVAASPTKSASKASSRSSNESHQSSFLQNLQNRFRKSSNASTLESDAQPPPPPTDPASRVEATRAVKRFLSSVVRDDWDFSSGDARAHEKLHSHEPIGYRAREEAQSDLDTPSNRGKRRAGSDPYRFENPDAIATSILERKRKRRRLVEQEMEVNPGFRTWAQRRDAWTGAVVQKPTPKKQASPNSSLSRKVHHRNTSTSNSTDSSSANWPLPAASWPQSPTSATTVSSTDSSAESSPEDLSGPYLPIYSPLFPDSHALRSRIKPVAYPTIYTKIVMQSLTPNIPIPLTHMIGALVEGWKTEGQWPATQPAQDPIRDKRNGKTSAFALWRRAHKLGTASASPSPSPATSKPPSPYLQQLPSENRSSSSKIAALGDRVKRALGVGPSEAEAELEELGIEFEEPAAAVQTEEPVAPDRKTVEVEDGHVEDDDGKQVA